MHKLESTYEWETGWNDRCEDTYWDGEMTAYRRIKHPRNADEWVTFIFTEDRGASQCWMTADSGSCTILTKEGFDCAIAALEEGFDCAVAEGE